MAGNAPSLWRRVTDLGARIDQVREHLHPRLELPATAYTTHEVVRRDGRPLDDSDHMAIAAALCHASPSLAVGLVSAHQIEQIRTSTVADAPLCYAILTLRARHIALGTGVGWTGVGPHDLSAEQPIAGVIRLRPDGGIPSITRPRTADVRAPWRVSQGAMAAAQALADRWECSQSQAVSRALVERLEREREGETRLLDAVARASRE